MNLILTQSKLRHTIQENYSLQDGIDKLSGRSVFIYGAGNFGRIIYHLLISNGVRKEAIAGFLDMAAGENNTMFDLPIYRPDDQRRFDQSWTDSEIVISIYSGITDHSAIRQRLLELGYKHVRTGYETAISFHRANDSTSRISDSDFLRTNIDNILKGFHFWNDEQSLMTYANHFAGYASNDINCFLTEKSHEQYFAPFFRPEKDYKRFIDCGAFDGDTIRVLVDNIGKVEDLFLFEPCGTNFRKLSHYIHKHESHIAERIVLFPCGAWKNTEQLQFNDEAAAASTITQNGSSFIQCVAIDDVLLGACPTFIKMDIEGAELEALKGAASTIRRCKPNLAISVYHSLSHFWEIPELVRQMLPEYHLYLRTYGAAGFESVMYAVAGSE